MPTILEELAGISTRKTSYSELDGMVRILIPFFLSINVVFVKDIYSALLLSTASFCLLIWAGVPIRLLKTYIALILSLSLFIVISFVLFTQVPGRTLYETTLFSMHAERGLWEWRIVVTDTALLKSAFFLLRILAMIFIASLFVATVSDRDIVWGLRRLKVPAGLAVSAALFFRGLSFFASDFLTVREAMMARGVDFERTSLVRRFTLYANALIPLLSLMVTRSLEISLSLESRGIAPSTRFSVATRSSRLNIRDYCILIFLALFTLLFAWWSTWQP
ncbi:MAG: energy-coupling factor transporter transmembrane component T [Infirmifilum sp.]